MLTPADKTAYNGVAIWKIYYISSLKQTLSTAKSMNIILFDERSDVYWICNIAAK